MSEQDFLRILRAELQPIRDDIRELKTDVSVLKQDVSSLKQDVSSLKQDVCDLKQRMGKLEEKTDYMNKKIMVIQQDLSELKASNRYEHNEMRREMKRFKDAQDTIIEVLGQNNLLPLTITT